MHSVTNNTAPIFLIRVPGTENAFELKYRFPNGQYYWDLDAQDYIALVSELVDQFGPQVKNPPVRGDRDYSKVGICAYCERDCDMSGGESNNEIDHFRPRKDFNALTFEWSNLMYICHRCNYKKGCKFPKNGYVNPREPGAEAYFEYDLQDGAIKVNPTLAEDLKAKAEKTIRDLDLHATHLNALRVGQYNQFMVEMTKANAITKRKIVAGYQSRRAPFSSFVRAKYQADINAVTKQGSA